MTKIYCMWPMYFFHVYILYIDFRCLKVIKIVPPKLCVTLHRMLVATCCHTFLRLFSPENAICSLKKALASFLTKLRVQMVTT